YLQFEIYNSASLLLSPSITSFNGVGLYLSGLATFPASQITSITNSYFDFTGGGTPNFSNVTNITNTRLYAHNGGQLSFPGVTSYNVSTIGNCFGGNLLRADGGSILNLSNVSTLSVLSNGATCGQQWEGILVSGGTIDLSGVTSINYGNTEDYLIIRADN